MDPLPLLDIQKLSAPLRQRVEGVLRDAIVSGVLAPGQRLTERELTQMTGVSRTLVREALRQLESERLIAVIPNKGPVVRELTPTEAKELYAIRAVLEGLAARHFVEHADGAMMERLRHAVNAVVAAYEKDDLQQALECKNRFYDVLFEGAASETLASMLTMLHARILRWRALGLMHPRRSPTRSAEAVKGLKSIYAAIRSRDAERAEHATREEAARGAVELMRVLAGNTAKARTRRA